MAPQGPTKGQLGACGRKTYFHTLSASQGKLIKWHWGDHTQWIPKEVEIPADEDVMVSPDTALYGVCRDDESDGAVWVENGYLHFVWQDHSQWGTYKYSYDTVPENMDDNTPLAASGRLGFQGVWWAGDRQIYFMHMGGYNDWERQVHLIENEVPIQKGDRLYSWSRGSEADGLVWPGSGALNVLYHESEDWDTWKSFTVEAELTPSTLLASCGRAGFYGIWWAAPSGDRIRMLHAGTHTDWEATYVELDNVVSVTTDTPLGALCAEGQYDGIAWKHAGKMHHLYETSPNFGTWVYDTYEIEDAQ